MGVGWGSGQWGFIKSLSLRPVRYCEMMDGKGHKLWSAGEPPACPLPLWRPITEKADRARMLKDSPRAHVSTHIYTHTPLAAPTLGSHDDRTSERQASGYVCKYADVSLDPDCSLNTTPKLYEIVFFFPIYFWLHWVFWMRTVHWLKAEVNFFVECQLLRHPVH